MGFLRLALAFSVVFSHTEHWPFGFNTGVAAVVGFFMISGFVMTALCEKYYYDVSSIPSFYADRMLRLYPQYIVYVVATIIVLAIAGAAGPMSPHIPVHNIYIHDVILNIIILPYEVSLWVFPHSFYLQQSWSLGLEMAFYMVIPFILIYRLRIIALVLSAVFFLAPYTALINTDLWGYRQLPGTLFMFLTGSLIYSARHRRLSLPIYIVWAYCSALLIGTMVWPEFKVPYNREVLTGIILVMPVLWALRFQPGGRFDRLAGDLSYGVFLNHNVMIYTLWSLGIQHFGPRALFIVATSSLALSALTFRFVETPFLQLRHRWLRGRANAQKLATAI